MTPDDLREQLAKYRLKNSELARLIGVTPRAVTAWLTGYRPITGPVVAWFDVVGRLTPNARALYFHRLRDPQFGERTDEFGMTYEVEQ